MFYDIKKNPQAVACGLFPRKKERYILECRERVVGLSLSI